MHMAIRSLRTVKSDLAHAFPEVEFTFGTAGRGHDRGHSVMWTGGPSAPDVRHAANLPWRKVYHFMRENTPAEREAARLAYEVEAQAWEADRPAREAREAVERAERAAAGRAKAAATRAETAERRETLARLFPGVAFKVLVDAVAWTDGPAEQDVANATGVAVWRCARQLSREWHADRIAREAREAELAAQAKTTTRLARRLATSKARAVIVARAKARVRARGVQLDLFAILFTPAAAPDAGCTTKEATMAPVPNPDRVIIRAWRESPHNPIALFIDQPDSADTVNSYQRLGQHGAADLDIIRDTLAVDPDSEPARSLLAELRGRGYHPVVLRRLPKWHRQVNALAFRDLVNAQHDGRELARLSDKWIRRIGGGMHPDTRGADYVVPDGARLFTDTEAAEYDADIERMFELGDPYAACIAAARREGVWPA